MRIVRESAVDGEDSREAELFGQAQTGDRGAFGQLAIRLQDRLYNSILRVVGDHEEAKELTQETFVKALANIESFRGQSRPYTWLYRIGINLAISHLRKVRRRRTFSLDAPCRGSAGDDQGTALADRLSGGGTDPAEAVERAEAKQNIMSAMGRLDANTRALLVMRDIDGMDYQQMAEVLEVPLGTLKSRLFRARLALRDEYSLLCDPSAESVESSDAGAAVENAGTDKAPLKESPAVARSPTIDTTVVPKTGAGTVAGTVTGGT